MRRAVLTSFRTARRATIRRLSSHPNSNPISPAGLHTNSLRNTGLRNNVLTSPSLTQAIRRYSSSSSGNGPMRVFRTLPRGPVATVGAFAAAICAYQIWSPSPSSSPGLQTQSPQSDFVSQQTRQASNLAQSPQSSDRKALVVDNDQFFTGQIVGDGPLAKDTDDRGRKVLEMLSPEQATAHIRRNEQSYLVGRGRGVVRYDLVQLPSNDPIEDDKAEKIIEVPFPASGSSSSDWMFWGVFDGHSGWTTSAKLRQALISFAAKELNTTYKSALPTPPSPSSVDEALKSAFLKLDNEICNDSVEKLFKDPSRTLGAEILAPALSGSCALLSFYDSQSGTLRVACTGDSRAVLGRKNAKTGKWFATPLSEDQTGSNPSEEARMRAEHPNEPQVIYRGRVLGNLEPTRAFGDAAYKWSRDVQEKIKAKFWGRSLNPLLKTPPYVTAEPVVTSTQIQPSQGDFVVLATDGLWEMLTNEEVVGLVGQWVEAQANKSSPASGSNWLPTWFQGKPKNLPVEKGGNMDKSGKGSDKGDTPIRQQQWQIPDLGHGRFVVEDKNAATHLVRNALGGRDRDMVSALLTLPSPYSRRYRDDLTVEVIFFGDAQGDGRITINEEATAAPQDLKAKL